MWWCTGPTKEWSLPGTSSSTAATLSFGPARCRTGCGVRPDTGPGTGDRRSWARTRRWSSSLSELKGYFDYLTLESRQRFDAGMSAVEAARDIDLGPYSGWSEDERVIVNVGCVQGVRGSTPSDEGTPMDQMAAWGERALELARKPTPSPPDGTGFSPTSCVTLKQVSLQRRYSLRLIVEFQALRSTQLRVELACRCDGQNCIASERDGACHPPATRKSRCPAGDPEARRHPGTVEVGKGLDGLPRQIGDLCLKGGNPVFEVIRTYDVDTWHW